MKHNYRETTEDCQGCGATAGDRKRNQPTEPQGLSNCSICATDKCSMCDMGDDVTCGNCEDEPSDPAKVSEHRPNRPKSRQAPIP